VLLFLTNKRVAVKRRLLKFLNYVQNCEKSKSSAYLAYLTDGAQRAWPNTELSDLFLTLFLYTVIFNSAVSNVQYVSNRILLNAGFQNTSTDVFNEFILIFVPIPIPLTKISLLQPNTAIAE